MPPACNKLILAKLFLLPFVLQQTVGHDVTAFTCVRTRGSVTLRRRPAAHACRYRKAGRVYGKSHVCFDYLARASLMRVYDEGIDCPQGRER